MRTMKVTVDMEVSYDETEVSLKDLEQIELDIESECCNVFAEFDKITVVVEG